MGSSRRCNSPRGAGGLPKAYESAPGGGGSEGLSVRALFEKFLIIVIVVFPILIVRATLVVKDKSVIISVTSPKFCHFVPT